MNSFPLSSFLTILFAGLLCSFASFAWTVGGELEVRFLDIGQGDSILISTPHGRQILIDGGPGTTLLERLGEESSFWMKDIDLMVLTHPDLDHLEGLVEVLPRYRIHRLLMTGVVHESRLYQAFLERVALYEIPVSLADPQQDWLLDKGVYLDIVSPEAGLALAEVDSPNDTSIMARLIYGESILFLTGDGEEAQEQQLLLTDSDLRSEVFKSGHHGSTTSGMAPLIRAIESKRSIITSGRENPFDHPHLETVLGYDEAGIEWINTKDLGTITLVSSGDTWRVLP